MELSLDLLWNKNLKKIGTSGTYPSEDNCYIVNVYNKDTYEHEYTIHYCPKPVFEMWEVMKKIKTKYKISKIDALPIIRSFNDLGDWKYSEASNDISMNIEDI